MKSKIIKARLATFNQLKGDCSGDESASEEAPSDNDSSDNSESSFTDESSCEMEDEPPVKRVKLEDEETASDGTKWIKLAPGGTPGRLPAHAIFHQKCGPTAHAKKHIMKGQASSALKLLITQEMIEGIKSYTEAEAFRITNTEWKVSTEEIWAFIGLLFARGAYSMKNISINFLWSLDWGPKFFGSVMSRNRFKQLIRFIRFDDKTTRTQRLVSDKFAITSDTWGQFIENSQECFNPGAVIAIDEQLFPTKTRCRFLQYMRNKPDKWGIKFWLAADVDTKYLVNGFPYLGRDEARTSGLGKHVVLKLVEPYLNCGRCIVTDNFFTGTSLAEKLLSKKTSLVGTIRANRRELPLLAKSSKDKMVRYSSELFLATLKSGLCTLTTYKSKPTKKVNILSTRHKSVQIGDGEKKLPETVTFYNANKFGVDVLDQKARLYTTKVASRKWPLQVFCNILDLAGINAHILYTETSGLQMPRQAFLLQLAEELTEGVRSVANKEEISSRARVEETSTPTTSTMRKQCQVRLCNKN